MLPKRLIHGDEVLQYINRSKVTRAIDNHNSELECIYNFIINNCNGIRMYIHNAIDNDNLHTEIKIPVDPYVNACIRACTRNNSYYSRVCDEFKVYIKQLNIKFKENGYKIIYEDNKYYIVLLSYIVPDTIEPQKDKLDMVEPQKDKLDTVEPQKDKLDTVEPQVRVLVVPVAKIVKEKCEIM